MIGALKEIVRKIFWLFNKKCIQNKIIFVPNFLYKTRIDGIKLKQLYKMLGFYLYHIQIPFFLTKEM